MARDPAAEKPPLPPPPPSDWARMPIELSPAVDTLPELSLRGEDETLPLAPVPPRRTRAAWGRHRRHSVERPPPPRPPQNSHGRRRLQRIGRICRRNWRPKLKYC